MTGDNRVHWMTKMIGMCGLTVMTRMNANG